MRVALAAMAVTLLSPVTVWGVEEFCVVPFSSWPTKLAPQQDTVLLAKRAQLWEDPVAIAVASVFPRAGGVGAERGTDPLSPPQAERTARLMRPRKALLQLHDMMDLPWKAAVRFARSRFTVVTC